MTVQAKKNGIIFFIFSCFVVAILAPMTKAQNGITVTPTSITATIAAGDETREKVTVSNSSPGEVEVEVEAEQPVTQDGAALIKVDLERITLKPGESADVEVHIAVPPEARPKGQGAAVTFDIAGSSNVDVAIVGRIRVAIDLNVIEPVSDAHYSYPLLVTSAPVTFTLSGRNTGDFPAAIEGRVVISSLFGEDVSLEQSCGQVDNEESFAVQAVWDDPPLIGIRKVTMSLASGVGAPDEMTGYMIVFSWKLLLAIILILGASVLANRKIPALANLFRRKWRQ